MSMSDQLLELGIALSKSGSKRDANEIFETLLHTDRSNEAAWIWYIYTLETDQEQIAALEEFLTVFPNHSTARRALASLRKQARKTMTPPQPIEIGQRQARAFPPARPIPVTSLQQVRKSPTGIAALLLVILGVCILPLALLTFVKRYYARRKGPGSKS